MLTSNRGTVEVFWRVVVAAVIVLLRVGLDRFAIRGWPRRLRRRR